MKTTANSYAMAFNESKKHCKLMSYRFSRALKFGNDLEIRIAFKKYMDSVWVNQHVQAMYFGYKPDNKLVRLTPKRVLKPFLKLAA